MSDRRRRSLWGIGRTLIVLEVAGVAVAVVAVVTAGCQTSGTSTEGAEGTGSGDVTLEGACKQYKAAFCARMSRCQPVVVRRAFGDEATCRSRLAHDCAADARLPGVNLTPDCDLARAKAFRESSCYDEPVEFMICMAPGSLADGEPCRSSLQCAGGYCRIDYDDNGDRSGCGVCEQSQDFDWNCDGAVCQDEERCIVSWAGHAQCRTPQPEGEDCTDRSALCEKGLVCRMLPCIDQTSSCHNSVGACSSPASRGDGETCTSEQDCDASKGLSCYVTMRKCMANRFAEMGQPCAGMYCTRGDCVGSEPTCVPFLEDDAPCDPKGERRCFAPASCVNGRCTLPEAITCP